jgi:cytochrome c oxidase cbb3-type subunit 3
MITSRALIASVLMPMLGLIGACEREQRSFTSPASNSRPSAAARQSENQPAVGLGGEVPVAARNTSPYDNNAYAVAQGKRLFRWYNCNGCHANGGGGMGPALMDDTWIYGNEPSQLFETVMRGRPNGMPSFGGHIPEDQAWQIVAYLRSMDGKIRKDVAPGRADGLSPGAPEVVRAPLLGPKAAREEGGK